MVKRLKTIAVPALLLLWVSLTAGEQVTVNPERTLRTEMWITKGETITFSVSGTWSMWDKWSPVDSRGHTNFQRVGRFYLGTLTGQVEGGEDFAVTDGLKYTSPVSGRLILYANRGNYGHLKASGSINVVITGGQKMSYPEAETAAGWNLSQLDTARDVPYLTPGEKDVIYLVNKVRTDPPRFAKQYLENRKKDGAYAAECYSELLATKPLKPLMPSKALYSGARDHAINMGKAGRTGHNGTDGSSPADRVKRYGRFTGPYQGPWENCSYGYDDPIEIVLQLLIDDGVPSRGHRKNIMEKAVNYIGTAIEPHTQYRFNCVMDFADAIEDK